MPIRLSYDLARQRLDEALLMARSDRKLPQEWIDRAKKVASAPSKTFTPMLGTALLAKATDSRVDPFSLKTRNYPTAYSARSLCKDVLVPSSIAAGVSLNTTGREPLNNQPFFRYERVAPDMAVHASSQLHLDYLCDCLGQLAPLDEKRSLLALAAFLRARLEEPSLAQPVDINRYVLDIETLALETMRYVEDDPEGGRRGQALVAAALDLVFPEVSTSRVNDPSRHWPGDIAVSHEGVISLVVEVKQRAATAAEIVLFVGRCGRQNVRRAIVTLLAPDQPDISSREIQAQSWRQEGVHLTLLFRADQVLRAALTWSVQPLESALRAFPHLMGERLRQLEVGAESLEEWASRFRADVHSL